MIKPQQEPHESVEPSAPGAPQLSAGAQKAAAAAVVKGNIAADANRRRQQQALVLQRERILSERTSSPHRRSALSTALAEIEERLSELGWTVHL